MDPAAPKPGPKRVVICLHGSGDTGDGLRSWIRQVVGDEFEKPLRAAGIEVMFPSAVPIPYTLGGGRPLSVWFDRKGLAPQFPEDRAGVAASCARIEACLAGADEVAVFGFSQGGCQALHAGLKPNPKGPAVKAVVCLSSFLPLDSQLPGSITVEDMPPVLMCHGLMDRMVRAEWGQATAEGLRQRGVAVEWVPLPGLEHDMSAGELLKASKFLRAGFGL